MHEQLLHDVIDRVMVSPRELTNGERYARSQRGHLFTGLFGMNVKGLPFTDDEFGFTYAVAMCALSSLAMYVAVRRMGILR